MFKFSRLCLGLMTGIVVSTVAMAQEKTPQWPFDQIPAEELRKMDKKVFAHYFSQFPISIDDGNPASDYYAKGYLSPDGENGKHKAYGGFLRERPIPRMPRLVPNWPELDVYDEVKMAAEAGLDGFSYDILTTTGGHWNKLLILMKQVNAYGRGMKILLMPDMTAELKTHPENMVPAILKIAKDPSLYRLPDGRLLIAPYCAEVFPPDWWAKQLEEFKRNGVEVAFMPLFQGWWKYLKDYQQLSWGFSDWGTSALDEQVEWRDKAARTVDRFGKVYMAEVRPQDCRPHCFWAGESGNSALFRATWKTAIETNAGMVQIITWSDYSEGSEIEPSTSTRWAFYDLTAYYTAWFKTGKPPEIVRDGLYYFYRTQRHDAVADPKLQKQPAKIIGKATNEIELLAFLKAPAKLRISIGGMSREKDFPAGIHSFRVPLVEGTPKFVLLRNGKEEMQLTGNWKISNRIKYADLLYHADGGTKEAPRTYTGPKEIVEPPVFGKLMQRMKSVPAGKYVTVQGNPSTAKMPSGKMDKGMVIAGQKGTFTVIGGGGPGGIGIDLGNSFKLADNTEIIFYVKRLEMRANNGWVAFFMNAIGNDGKTRFGLTPRNPSETYVSGSWPGKPFSVIRGNFPVKYPAIYRLRRAESKLQFLFGNHVVGEVNEKEHGVCNAISIVICAEKADACGLLEFSGVEQRQLPVK